MLNTILLRSFLSVSIILGFGARCATGAAAGDHCGESRCCFPALRGQPYIQGYDRIDVRMVFHQRARHRQVRNGGLPNSAELPDDLSVPALRAIDARGFRLQRQ